MQNTFIIDKQKQLRLLKTRYKYNVFKSHWSPILHYTFIESKLCWDVKWQKSGVIFCNPIINWIHSKFISNTNHYKNMMYHLWPTIHRQTFLFFTKENVISSYRSNCEWKFYYYSITMYSIFKHFKFKLQILLILFDEAKRYIWCCNQKGT